LVDFKALAAEEEEAQRVVEEAFGIEAFRREAFRRKALAKQAAD